MEVSPWFRHSDAASDGKPTRGHYCRCRRTARDLWRADRTVAEEADEPVRQTFSRVHRLLAIAPTGRLGRCDASPKGAAPGFVQVIDDTTLLIPDRLGNNRVDTPGNLVARLGIGLIFFVPGINETSRINGQACVTTDHALLEPLAVNGKVPRSGILVSAEEIYFHCGKALIRSDLWNSEKHLRHSAFPSLATVLTEQIGGAVGGDPERLERYKTSL
jgi:PPOX class probable FMN-dependent enzyme